MSMADLDRALGQSDLRAWWHTKDKRVAGDVVTNYRHIRASQTYRYTADLLHMQLYADLRYVGLWPDAVVEGLGDLMTGRINENYVRRICETAHAKIIKPRPLPEVLTDGANYELQDQAHLLNKWILGTFQREHVWQKRSEVAKHKVLTGTGLWKVYSDGQRPRVEVAPSWEVWVDSLEGRYGDGWTWYQTRTLPMERAVELWPKKADAILRAPRMTYGDELATYSSVRDAALVQVVESWHRGEKGAHVVCVDDQEGVLERGDWGMRRPFVVDRYVSRPWGLWGAGLPEILAGGQFEMQRLARATQESLRRFMPMILIERGARIVKSQVQNLIGMMLEYSGTPPTVVAPSPIPPEWWKQRAETKAAMYETSGISTLTASGMKPAGLNSGKALREYADIEAEGLIEPARNDREALIELTEQIIEVQREIVESEDYDEQPVKLIGEDAVETIKWSEIDLDRDAYEIRLSDASALATTLAGKLSDLDDMRNLGIVVEPADMANLLQIPDLRKFTNEATAPKRIIQRIVEVHILARGNYVEPEPTWNLELSKRVAASVLLYAQETYYRRFDQLDDEERTEIERRHGLVRTFIAACQGRLDEIAQQQQAQLAAQAPMPAAAPVVPTNGAAAPMPPA